MGLKFLALACLVGAAFAGPVQRQSENRCAKQCDPQQYLKYNFEHGKCMVYKFLSINKAERNENTVETQRMEGIAEFHMQTPCEGILKIKNVRTSQDDEDSDLKKKLEMPLSFSVTGSTFENVCPSSEESTESLNFKKAMLTSMNMQMPKQEKSQKVEEKDSFGKCLAEYNTIQDNEEKVIKKVKDLRTCTNRPMLKTTFLEKKFPSSVLFQQDHLECRYYITNELLKKVHCQEKQTLINPLMDRKSVKFSGIIELNHIETKPADKQSWKEPVNREEILYKIDEPRQGDRNVKEVERILKSICPKNKKVIDMNVSKDYLALQGHFRNFQFHELDKLYESLRDGSLCDSKKVRDMFVDVLRDVATDPAIKLLVKLRLKNEVSEGKWKLCTLSWAWKQDPTKDTVAAIIPLLKKDQSASTVMGCTAMVNNLCSSQNCDKIKEVQEVVKIFNECLGSDDDKQMLMALSAFGNMGYLGKAHDNIAACIEDSSKPTRVRMAGIDAMRRMDSPRPPCFMRVLQKPGDPEIKIAAFSSVMKHADEKQLKEIKRIAEKETDIQVSSYMKTFIQNMKKTQSRRHQNIKRLLQNYEIHPRKGNYLTHSKNIELSAFNKLLNVGVFVEADLIHSNATKFPTSFSIKIGGSLPGGTDLDILEFRIKTEGIDKILQNTFAMKDKIPEFEKILERLAQKPTLEEFKKELSYLSLDKIFSDTNPGIFLNLRVFGVETLSVSTDEMSRWKEMLKIADLLTKLSRGKDTDFSHSFVFLNSKLIVPSITGRPYFIHLAGSSTLGLTAKAKVDVLNLPQEGHVHIHMQPSVTGEWSVTCGMGSSTRGPSIKHVSRFHMQSDKEVKFVVDNGHVAKFSLNFPSENIALGKISTDIVKIDRHHNEKSIFGEKQKIIDYSFNHLNKPLGLTVYTSFEMPKVRKSFPYLYPALNGEIALKRSDVKSYELRFEIPKKASPSMKYEASFSTPGSKYSRNCKAVVEFQHHRGRKDVFLELTSPFKTIGGSGSFTNNDQRIEGSMELHTSDTKLVSVNITSNITSSKSRKNYEICGKLSILNQEPTRVDGTVAVIKGRKHYVSFDFKTNKPQSKPLTLKGTIMKEGRIDLSPKSEWKLSSEVSIESPVCDLKLRKTIEKRSKQSQMISTNLAIDYLFRGRNKHSLTISGTSQKSSNKINTNAKLESTQYPGANVYLTWDIQRDSLQESFKNDITLKYGQNPDETYINLKQKTKIPKTGPGHCSITLEVPHRNIHYELNTVHDVDLKSEQPRINVGLDLCCEQEKCIRSKLDFKCESTSRLRASTRFQLESPLAHFILEDKIEETEDNVIEGKTKFQYIRNNVIKVSQFQYKYRKSIKDSKVHHEIESSIQTPLSRSPINGKASIELSSESLAIAGQVGSEYSVQAHLKEYGFSHFNINFPMLKGTVNFTEEYTKKSVNVDLNLKTRRPRHIVGSATVDLGKTKNFEIRVQPDVDHHPEKEIVISIGGERKSRNSKDIITGISKLKIFDFVDVSLVEKGDGAFLGDHEFTMIYSCRNKEPVTIIFQRKTSEENGKTTIVVSKENVEKIKFELDAALKQTSNKRKLSIEISLSSQDHSFEDIHMSLKNQVTRSESSQTIQTTVSFKKNNKVYKTEWNSDIQPNGLEVKAQIQTPHANYEKSAVDFSLHISDSSVSSSVNIVCLNDKKISIQTEITTKSHGLRLTSKLSSFPEILKEVVLQVTFDNHRSEKSFEVRIDSKNNRVCELQGKMTKSSRETQIEGRIKLSNLPKLKYQGLHVKLQSARNSALVSGSIQMINGKEISVISDIKKEGDIISTTTLIATPYDRLKNVKGYLSIENQASKRSILCYLDKNGERISDAELTITSSSQNTEVKGRWKTLSSPEISAHVKCEKTGESFLLTAKVLKGASTLFSTRFNRLSSDGGEKLLLKTNTLKDTLLDLEFSRDKSSKNSKKYNLKVKGPFHPEHFTFTMHYNDKNSVSTELRACKELKSSKVCYRLKCDRKDLDYRVDLVKYVGESHSKTLGKLHALMTAEMSKVTVEVNEKKYGYELKLHRRQHENDLCSFDFYIYFPHHTSRVRASILHNARHVNLEVHAIPNTDNPTRKLMVEIKKDINPDNQEISGYIKISHPRMSKPVLFTGELRSVGQHVHHTPLWYKAKFVLDFGTIWEKILVIEALPNIDQEAHGIRTMEYKMYTDDKSIDASLKLIRQISRHEKKTACEWKYGEKKGGLALTLSDKNRGKTIKVSFFSPTADYEVQGNVAQNPNDINVSVTSHGRKLKEISIKVSDSCAIIELRESEKSDLVIKNYICVNKAEGRALQLLKVNVEYRGHNCLKIRLGVNPDNPEYFDVLLKCNKDESCRALKEWINLDSLLHGRSIQVLKQDVLKKVRQVKQDVMEPHVRKFRKFIQDLKDDLFSKLKNRLDQHQKFIKEHIRKFKEIKQSILRRIQSAIPTHIKEAYQKYYQDVHREATRYYQDVHREATRYYQVLHREATRYYQKVKKAVIRYWPPICEIGWYCSDIKLAYKNFKAEEITMLFHRIVNQFKQFLSFRIIYPSDIINFIRNSIEAIHRTIVHIFGRIVGKTIMYELRKFASKIEAYVRQKCIDFLDEIIKKFHNMFHQNENLRTAQDLILNAKDEIVNAWKNRENIVTFSVRRAESNFKQNLKNIVDEQVKVVKHDPQEGEFSYRIRQPLSRYHIEKLKETIYRLLRTFSKYLNQ